MPIVYDELKSLAGRHLRRNFSPITLQATSLVHEAYLKLARGRPIDARDRAHFLAIASRAMRQVIVEQVRVKQARKRGGDWKSVTLGDGHQSVEVDANEVLALNEAIESLEPRQRQVVEARFFAGLDERETAEMLGVTERTVRRDWVKARAWLVRAMMPGSPSGAGDGVAIARTRFPGES